MRKVVIENPVINSQFAEPARHFRFTDEGITNEIVDAAWSSPYATTSQPFAEPANGKIAVKVINHYGDEVLKVFDVK